VTSSLPWCSLWPKLSTWPRNTLCSPDSRAILRAGGRGHVPVLGEDFQFPVRGTELSFRPDADDHALTAGRRRGHQPERDHLGVGIRPDRRGAVARVSQPAGVPAPGHREPGQYVLVRAHHPRRHAEPGLSGAVGLQIGVHAALDVHVVPYRESLAHRHDVRQRAAQVTGHPGDQF
jgi:hypothetical protein